MPHKIGTPAGPQADRAALGISPEKLRHLLHRGHAHEETLLGHAEADASHGARPLPLDAGDGARPQGRVLDAVPDLEREHRFLLGGLGCRSHAHPGHCARAGHLSGRATAPRPEGAGVALAPRVAPLGATGAPIGPRAIRTGTIRTPVGGAHALPGRGCAAHVEELGGDVVEEPRGRHLLRSPPGAANGRARQVEALARTRDGHVRQAAFLLQLALVAEAALVREGAVLHAGDEHGREFEALGGVDGHEGDLSAALAFGGHLVRVGHEGDALKEVRERRAGRVGREGTGDRVQFRQVFHARGVLRILAAAQLRQVAGAVQDLLEDVGLGRAARLRGAQGFDEPPEGGRGLRGAGGDAQDLGRHLGRALGGDGGRGRGRSRARICTVASTRVLPRRPLRGNGNGRISRGLV